jgi:nucleotide-binding universal stress UspA family protein
MVSLVQDEVRAELTEYLRSAQQEIHELALRHAELCVEIAETAPDALEQAIAEAIDRREATRSSGRAPGRRSHRGLSQAARALEFARMLSLELSATLSAFEAITLPGHRSQHRAIAIRRDGEQTGREARDRIVALGGVEPHAAYGNAAEELAAYSAPVDLLVVGSRGYGPRGRLIHGSVSRELGRIARCPLLVLPRVASAVERRK